MVFFRYVVMNYFEDGICAANAAHKQMATTFLINFSSRLTA